MSTCEFAGYLNRPYSDEHPVAVYVCHACPGGVLVLDAEDHEDSAHPPAPPVPEPRHAGHDTPHRAEKGQP